MGMAGVQGTTGDESGDGSWWGIEDAGNSAPTGFRGGGGGSRGAPHGEQTSVAACGGDMTDFSESEGDNAAVIE